MLAVHPVSVARSRMAALRVLQRVRRDSAYTGPALARELASAGLDAHEAAYVTAIVHGVLSTLGVLDEALARHLRIVAEPRITDVLRLGTYELLFGAAPAYAVVDEAVSAARKVRPQASRLVNAVLRRLADEATEFPWGDPATDRDALGRLTGHPRWIVDLLLDSYGPDDGRRALEAGAAPAPSYIRLDPFASSREATLAALEPADPHPAPPDLDCFTLGTPAAAFRDAQTPGWFAMDAAAQFAPAACAPRQGKRILDIGAGRGNKTVCLQSIAVRGGGTAEITAVDVHAGKTAVLRERLAASGVPGVAVIQADATRLGEVLEPHCADAAMLDAPCTGLGTLRRYPEKRWRITPDDVGRMASLQMELLTAAAILVRPGGRLVYSTCSVAPAENGGVVAAFLAAEAGSRFRVRPVDELVPPEWERFVDDEGCFQSWPEVDGPDGHFVAVLERIAD